MNKARILAVDDNAGIRAALQLLLPRFFREVHLLASPSGIHAELREFVPDVVLLDMNFQTSINTGNEGLFWLSEIKKASPDTQVVLFTAYADISLAVEGMKRGAFDFIVKPWDNDRLVSVLESAASAHASPQRGQKKDPAPCGVSPVMSWGKSPAMCTIRNIVEKIAPTDVSVLITGENGTGKDVLAGEIHRLSLRSSGPMVCVDAGAITETLFESELFGHVKGAFTDARSDRKGKIEEADGGTLFLDEIGNIPMNLQAKLLRVLQNRTVSKVGSSVSVPVDIRLICATNRNLDAMVRSGEFREDLLYRINTMHIELPPLRMRTDEIVPLAGMFLERFAGKYRRNVTGISPEAASLLRKCVWNGNIRELQNVIERAVILSEGTELAPADLNLSSDAGQSQGAAAARSSQSAEHDVSGQTLEQAEETAIRAAMEKCAGNLTHVAKYLNISRPTLYTKLKKYNI